MKAKPQEDRSAYMRAYQQRPEVKERTRAYMRAYMRAYRQQPKVKRRTKAYMKAYLQRPDVRERIRIRERIRYHVQHTIPDAMLSPRVKRLLALAEGWT